MAEQVVMGDVDTGAVAGPPGAWIKDDTVYSSVLGGAVLQSQVPLFTSRLTAGWADFANFMRVEGAKLVPYSDPTFGMNAIQVKPSPGGEPACVYRMLHVGTVPGKQKVAMGVQTFGGNDYWVWIDGKPTTRESVIINEAGMRYIVVTLPDEKAHEIAICTGVPVQSITWEDTAYLSPPARRPLRLAVLGDSYTIGSENILAGGMASMLGLLHGWEVYTLGQGATGFSAVLPAGSTDGRTKYADTGVTGRLQQIKALYDAGKIDAALVFGSLNDFSTPIETYGGDVGAVFTYFQQNMPNLPVLNFGPVGINPTQLATDQNQMNAAQAGLFKPQVSHTEQWLWFRPNALIDGTPHLKRSMRRLQAIRVGGAVKERLLYT